MRGAPLTTTMKWFINLSYITVIFYLFGMYLNLAKKIEVVDFYYSPIILLLLISTLQLSLVLFEKLAISKNILINSDNHLQQIAHNNLTIDIDVLLNDLYPILQKEDEIKFVDFIFLKNNDEYICKISLTLKSDKNVPYDAFTKKINMLVLDFFKEKFSSDLKIRNEIFLTNTPVSTSVEEKNMIVEDETINNNIEVPAQEEKIENLINNENNNKEETIEDNNKQEKIEDNIKEENKK